MELIHTQHTPMYTFSQAIQTTLSKGLHNAVKDSSFIKSYLEGEFPKLLRLFTELSRRMKQQTGGDVLNYPTTDHASLNELAKFNPGELLRVVLSEFEAGYISTSLQRLNDPLNLMFSTAEGTPPQHDEVQALLRLINNELAAVMFDSNLHKSIQLNVEDIVKQFSNKCKLLSSTGEQAQQITGDVCVEQECNRDLVNLLFYFHRSVSSHITSSSPDMHQHIVHTAYSIMHPWLDAVHDAILSIILTMHQQNYSPSSQQPTEKSLYIEELKYFLDSIGDQHLKHFTSQDFTNTIWSDICSRLVDLFIRHVSLLQPINDEGRKKLTQDIIEVEDILNKCSRTGGGGVRSVRALRAALTCGADGTFPTVDILPASTILHLMYSYGPDDLKPPHQNAGWSSAEYSSWLDEHTCERERLQLIATSLEAYVKTAKKQQVQEFTPVYLHMLTYLQRSLNNLKTSTQ